jgi:Leucine-rich repeat (LRR) protein
MLIALRRLVSGAARLARGHLGTVVIVTLAAAAIVVANVSGRTRYSVEEDLMVEVLGSPFPYRIERQDTVILPSLKSIANPPLVRFDTTALAADVAVALLLIAVLGAAADLVPWRALVRSRPGRVGLLVALAAVLALGGWAFARARPGYIARRDALAAIYESSDGFPEYSVEYPGPDFIWRFVWAGTSRCRSPKDADAFLDAALGRVVRIRGDARLLRYLAALPTVRAIEVTDDDPGLGDQSARLPPATSARLERASLDLTYIADLEGFARLPRLRFLKVAGNLGPESRWIGEFLALEALDVQEASIDEGAARLGQLKNLRVLVLTGTGVTDATLRQISGLAGLERLSLGANQITDEGVKSLENLGSLRSLDLGGCPIGDRALRSLARLTHLRSLDISDCWAITDAGLAKLAGLTDLEELNASNTRTTDAGLPALSGLRKLRVLDLSQTGASARGVAAALAECATLRSLNLAQTPADDRACASLRGLAGLESLDISRTQVGDAGVTELSGLRFLRSINVAGTRITDVCIHTLTEMQSLEEIVLSDTAVTLPAVLALRDMRQLRTLNVYGCPAISAAGMRELQEAMPSLDVVEPMFSFGSHRDGRAADRAPRPEHGGPLAAGRKREGTGKGTASTR